MRKITTGQLSDLVGMSISNLYVYRGRHKLNIIDEGSQRYVDLDDPINANFIALTTGRKGNVIKVADIDPKSLPKHVHRKVRVKRVNDKIRKDKEKTSSNKKPPAERAPRVHELIKPLTEFEKHKTEKMMQDAEIAKLRLDQLRGRVLPIDEAQNLFTMHFSSLTAEFYNAIDNYTVIVVDKFQGSRKDLSDLRKKLRAIVNRSVDDAKQRTKKEIQTKAEEYSKKRKFEDVT